MASTIRIKYANVGRRITAGLIDTFIFGMLYQGLEILYEKKMGTTHIFQFEVILSLIIFLAVSFLTSSVHQGTPGKILLKIKVTDLQGKRISFFCSLGRYGIYYFAFLMPTIILLSADFLVGILPIIYEIGFLHIMVLLLSIAASVLTSVGTIMTAFTKNNQALHDKIFNTLVIMR